MGRLFNSRPLSIAKKYRITVIEDVANGYGGIWNGKKLGSIGEIGCFG